MDDNEPKSARSFRKILFELIQAIVTVVIVLYGLGLMSGRVVPLPEDRYIAGMAVMGFGAWWYMATSKKYH